MTQEQSSHRNKIRMRLYRKAQAAKRPAKKRISTEERKAKKAAREKARILAMSPEGLENIRRIKREYAARIRAGRTPEERHAHLAVRRKAYSDSHELRRKRVSAILARKPK